MLDVGCCFGATTPAVSVTSSNHTSSVPHAQTVIADPPRATTLPSVNQTATARLLRAASARIQTASFGRRLHFTTLLLAALALVALLCARLLALLPNAWFTPLTLLAVPGLAL